MKQETWNTTINILGVNISTLRRQQVLKKIEQFLSDGPSKFSSRSFRSSRSPRSEAGGEASGQHQIVTPNPEFLLQAGKDEEFFYILNKADLAVPDGVGLKFAAWAMGKNIHRYAGVDLVKDVIRRQTAPQCRSAQAGQADGPAMSLRSSGAGRRQKIAVVNWKDGLSKKKNIEKVLREQYEIKNFFVADVDRKIGNWKLEIGNLKEYSPDVLFCTFGAPWQEKWIYHNLPKLPSVKLAIGVGGAFDFLTGKIRRAPKFLRVLGMEWLWRLLKQPWRWKRIYNAVIVFPWKFFKWRFICPFLYRPNVACLLYKKVISDNLNDAKEIKYKILLAERKDEPGHWQLPQGGTDGEDLMAAGARELSEEIDCDKFKPITCFNNLWKYKFNKEVGKYKTKRHIGYKGQKQGLFIAEFTGGDQDIKINFWDHSDWKWVDSANLIGAIHLKRKKATEIFLEKFNSINKEKH